MFLPLSLSLLVRLPHGLSLKSSTNVFFLKIFTYRIRNNFIFLFLGTVFIKRHALTYHNAFLHCIPLCYLQRPFFSRLKFLHKDLGQYSNIHYYSAEYLPMD